MKKNITFVCPTVGAELDQTASEGISLFGIFTLCLLVSSAVTFANSLNAHQAEQNVRPDLDPNYLTLRWYS